MCSAEDLAQVHGEEAVPSRRVPQRISRTAVVAWGAPRKAEGGVGRGVHLGQGGLPRLVRLAQPLPGAGEEPPGGGAGAAVQLPHGVRGFEDAREVAAGEAGGGLGLERVPAGDAVPREPDGRLARLPVGEVHLRQHEDHGDAAPPGR